MKNIRAYNMALQFTSMRVNENLFNKADQSKSSGIYNFRINGTVCHKIGPILPKNDDPKFAQIYIYDNDYQLNKRENIFHELALNKDNLLQDLQSYINSHNPYAKLYKNAFEILKNDPSLDVNIILKQDNVRIDKTFALPTNDEVAIIIPGTDQSRHETKTRNIVVKSKQDKLLNVSEIHSAYDPLHYVLMFPNGDLGKTITKNL